MNTSLITLNIYYKMEKTIYISKTYFKTVFEQHIGKGERLELIPGDYTDRPYMRFIMIDDEMYPRLNNGRYPTVTIDNEQIEKYLTLKT